MSVQGQGYDGSPDLLTSNVNQEVIPSGYSFYKFSFKNDQDCHVSINGGNPILIRADQGFSMELYDKEIQSFIISEPNITYNWIGAY